MSVLVSVLAIGLIGVVAYCVYLNNELMNERSRRFEAELWIDPISWEETK